MASSALLFREARGDAREGVRGLLLARWPPDVIDEWLREGQVFTVQDPAADPDDPPAGVAVTIEADAVSVELCTVYVTEPHRRRGAGRHLVLALADRCRARGLRRITAAGPDAGDDVAGLLVACGFRSCPEPLGRGLCLDL
jgi:GNAT superfamily N-acetyltransferase